MRLIKPSWVQHASMFYSSAWTSGSGRSCEECRLTSQMRKTINVLFTVYLFIPTEPVWQQEV